MTFIRPILIFLSLFIFFSFFAQDEPKLKWIELHGYVKDLQNLTYKDRFDSPTSINILHNRLNFKLNLLNNLTARIEIRNRIFYGDQIEKIPEFGKTINTYNGLMDLSELWIDEKSIVIHTLIDRLLIQYSTDKWDIKIGRQRINWGINTVWNPNDIFNAYNFLDFDYEERAGNDAIRIQHYFKNNSIAEIAYKPGKNSDESIFAALYKFNKKKYDFQFLSGVYQSDFVVGAGWAGSLKNTGLKGEISYFHPNKNSFDTSGTVSLSVMLDRTFKNDWYASLATLYNNKPSNVFGNTGSIISSNLSAKELFPFKYSFYGGVMKTISPITSINFSIIYSPKNNTLILFPSFVWNVSKNCDLNFTAQSFFAEQGSRYKTLGTALFLGIKFSF